MVNSLEKQQPNSSFSPGPARFADGRTRTAQSSTHPPTAWTREPEPAWVEHCHLSAGTGRRQLDYAGLQLPDLLLSIVRTV